MLAPLRRATSLRPSLCCLNQARTLTLTLRKMDEAMAHLKANPFYEQYKNKIEKVKDKHPEALVKAVEKSKATAASLPEDPLAEAAGVRAVSRPADHGKAGLAGPVRAKGGLNDIMKVELLSPLSADEVSKLWTSYWTQRTAVCGVVPADTYTAIKTAAAIYSKFLLPLPRDTGYEFVFTQFHADEFHVCTLANYQAHQENAPECLCLVHYTDLRDKGVVLMKGEYDTKVLSPQEAQYLANQLQLYYDGRDAAKLALVRCFNVTPHLFDHTSLITQLESLSLGAKGAGSS